MVPQVPRCSLQSCPEFLLIGPFNRSSPDISEVPGGLCGDSASVANWKPSPPQTICNQSMPRMETIEPKCPILKNLYPCTERPEMLHGSCRHARAFSNKSCLFRRSPPVASRHNSSKLVAPAPTHSARHFHEAFPHEGKGTYGQKGKAYLGTRDLHEMISVRSRLSKSRMRTMCAVGGACSMLYTPTIA